MRSLIGWVFLAFFLSFPLNSNAGGGTFVDEKGVIRWVDDKTEVHGFGVNYSLPFAHAYRMANRLGVDHKEAIRQDVYHLARLGFNLFRVHVWDTEISDTLGNLLQNSHLHLFDFTINEFKKRGFKFVITPIAYWGNGWPEPDEATPGFSAKFGKAGSLVHPDAIKAQENFLAQFLNHVNPFTGIAYKDDPDIIAFEVSNEPHHQGTHDEVVTFINRMVTAMRGTGTRTPIFYNMSHSIHRAQAYFDSNVQGGTFQWYPTGLVAGRAITGNFLPNVSDYHIPFAANPDFRREALLVYEFDAADVEGNHIYPAMARSFRTEGMQVATHFDYDAMFLAPFNTNYGTHFMSLPYAPQKAISLKIAGKVFHEVPRFKDFGPFPGNSVFDGFKVDYPSDLAQFVSDSNFFHSNSTLTVPPDIESLVEIVGFGNSPIVQYDGKGAYFLDRISPTTWRLEVMPDAHWLSDPYAPASPRRQLAAVSYRSRDMRINLPSLGDSFTITGINQGNSFTGRASNGQFTIEPGVYLLRESGRRCNAKPDDVFQNMRLNEFVAPAANLDTVIVKNFTSTNFTEGSEARIRFEVISAEKPQWVEVVLMSPIRYQTVPAVHVGRDVYEVIIPEDLRVHGTIRYQVVVGLESYNRTFPAGKVGRPFEWDFYDRSAFVLNFLPREWPIEIWNASYDWSRTMRSWHGGVVLKPGISQGDGRLTFSFPYVPLNQDEADSTRIYTFRFCFRDKVACLRDELSRKGRIEFKGKSLTGQKPLLEIALIDKNGMAFGKKVRLNSNDEIYSIDLSQLEPTRMALIPRPYPRFKPWFANHISTTPIDLKLIETIQVTLLPCDEEHSDEPYEFYLESFILK